MKCLENLLTYKMKTVQNMRYILNLISLIYYLLLPLFTSFCALQQHHQLSWYRPTAPIPIIWSRDSPSHWELSTQQRNLVSFYPKSLPSRLSKWYHYTYCSTSQTLMLNTLLWTKKGIHAQRYHHLMSKSLF